MAGGSFGVSSSSTSSELSNTKNKNTTSSFGVSPRVGVFVADNLVLGLDFGYSRSFAKHIEKSYRLNAGSYLRYYKFLGDKIALFADASVGVEKRESKYKQDQGPEGKNNISFIALKPGISYFIHQKLGLEATFGNLSFQREKTKYTYNTENRSTEYKTTNLGLNLGSGTFLVGANFYFNR
jgi:hypothetical protein